MHSVWPGRRNQLYLQGVFVGKGFRQEVMLELSLKGGTFQVKKKVGKGIQVEYGVRKSMEESAWWVRAGGVAAGGKVGGVAGTWSPRAI